MEKVRGRGKTTGSRLLKLEETGRNIGQRKSNETGKIRGNKRGNGEAVGNR